jgi:hypothetical protein
MIPKELYLPLPKTKSVNVKAIANMPMIAINHATTVMRIEPVFSKILWFLKKMPAPIQEPTVINITEKKLSFSLVVLLRILVC